MIKLTVSVHFNISVNKSRTYMRIHFSHGDATTEEPGLITCLCVAIDVLPVFPSMVPVLDIASLRFSLRFSLTGDKIAS